MKDWLSYFFGAFFSHTRAREGQIRSTMNGVLGLCLALCLMVGLLCAGYRLSLPGALRDAEDFLAQADAVLKDLDLTASDGTLQGDRQILSTDGLLIVVDLRDLSRVYDDFSVRVTDANGNDMPFEEYRALSAQDQTACRTEVVFSGKELDVTAPERQEMYLEYLQNAVKTDSALAEKLNKLQEDPQQEGYAEAIYVLYATDYYAGVTLSDGFAAVPTLQGYYTGLGDGGREHLMLFSQWCTACFESKGRTTTMMGYYTNMEGNITDGGTLALLERTFGESNALSIFTYFVNTLSTLPVLLVLWVLLTAALFGVCRFRQLESGHRLLGAFQIIGSFLAVSGGVAAVLGFLLSFFLSQEEVFSVSVMALYALFVLRSILFIVVELLGVVPGGEYLEYED